MCTPESAEDVVELVTSPKPSDKGPGGDGKVRDPELLVVGAQPMVKRAGLEMHVTPHMLRHTFALNQINAGTNIRGVSSIASARALLRTRLQRHTRHRRPSLQALGGGPRTVWPSRPATSHSAPTGAPRTGIYVLSGAVECETGLRFAPEPARHGPSPEHAEVQTVKRRPVGSATSPLRKLLCRTVRSRRSSRRSERVRS